MTIAFAFPPVVAMAAPPDGAAPIWVQLVPFAAILAIFYFIILLPMKRRQRKVAEFQAALKAGDKVVTTSGVYGVITKMDDLTVTLQVDDKTRIKFAKAAVAGYQGQDPVVPDAGTT
ncbi:MAG: preprotein translocase subunit YajC [Acidobacteria bacterium]|nr:preprotein translocase subunit YajC [Acidobacteriota bacterium]